jgi:hypothetical protein
VLAEDVAKRGLRVERRRHVVVGDFDHGVDRIHHVEVDDRVDLDRDVVFGDDLLRRHVVSDGT